MKIEPDRLNAEKDQVIVPEILTGMMYNLMKPDILNPTQKKTSFTQSIESPGGGMGSTLSFESDPYRISSVITKRKPLYDFISAGNITNVTFRSSGHYMKEIELAIQRTFGPQ